jgi:hypothetical protein
LLFQIAADYHKLAMSLEEPLQPQASAEARKQKDPRRPRD